MDDVKIHECFPTLVHEFKFEQAIAEQKIDEVVKKLESMLEQQIDVISKLNNEDIKKQINKITIAFF